MDYGSFLSTPILFITIFLKGEYSKLKLYFEEEHDFSYISLIFFLFISCSVVMITNSSFFISNEKNTSLFTQLLSDTKYIVITLIRPLRAVSCQKAHPRSHSDGNARQRDGPASSRVGP